MEKRNVHTWVLEALKTSPAVEVTDMKFFTPTAVQKRANAMMAPA